MKSKRNSLRRLERNRFSVFYDDLGVCMNCGSRFGKFAYATSLWPNRKPSVGENHRSPANASKCSGFKIEGPE